ncbi:MAG TPA: DUF5655 domain-containing protein [Pyrinomonadaceae bacterium]
MASSPKKKRDDKRSTTVAANQRPLWRCPECGERFVTRNLWHSCGKYTLEELFARSEPHVLPLFKKFAKMVRACGPVRMIPQKSRVAFQVRVRFAGAYPRKSHVLCGFALPYRSADPRFVKIEEYGRHFVGHLFSVASEADLDEQVQRWLHEAYEVGKQSLLSNSNTKAGSKLKPQQQGELADAHKRLWSLCD